MRQGSRCARVRAALAVVMLGGMQAVSWGRAPDAPPNRAAVEHARAEAPDGAARSRAGARPRARSPITAATSKRYRLPTARVTPRSGNPPPRAAVFRPSAAALRPAQVRGATAGRPRAATVVLGGPASRDPRRGDGIIGNDVPANARSPRR
jgi:hypothetical protein